MDFTACRTTRKAEGTHTHLMLWCQANGKVIGCTFQRKYYVCVAQVMLVWQAERREAALD